jgi:hypothetical protein
MRNLAVGGVAAALLVACPAASSGATNLDANRNFRSCDGYEIPSPRADGMNSSTLLWTTVPTDNLAAKASIGSGQWGMEACTAALADDHLLPAYWRRKVNLLQARALHRLELGDAKGALADLDLADAAILDRTDPFFARSQGISLGFLRAYALGRAGNQAGSEAAASQYLALRPYSRQGPFSATVVVGQGSDRKRSEVLERALAQLQPSTIDDIYIYMAHQGRWAEIIPLYKQLSTPKVRRRIGGGGWVQEYDVIELIGSNLFWIDRNGIYAYALATQGRSAEARAALAAATARLDAALVPDPPLKPENNPSQVKIQAAADKIKLQQALAQRGRAQLGRLITLVEMRLRVDEGGAAGVVQDLAKTPLQQNALGRELATALKARLKADPKTPAETLKAVDALTSPPPVIALAPVPQKPGAAQRGDANLLLTSLPLPETPQRMPRYRKAGAGIFVSEAGFSVTRVSTEFTDTWGPDVMGVEFRSLDTNAQVAEEMALLRAADLALQAGKTGVVVLDRHDVQHTVNNTYYGMVMSSVPDGFSTTLTVVFVDKANPPERLKGAEWRVIDARAVFDALSPIYLRPETDKKSKKR